MPWIYGKCKTGGIPVFQKTDGTGRTIVVYLVTHGPINAIPTIWIEGKTLTELGYTLNTDYKVYTGTAAQAVDTTIQNFDANWLSGLPGVAYVWIYFKLPADGEPPLDPYSFMCEVEGALVRDPRTDATLVNRFYRENTMLAIADVLTSKRIGGYADAEVDFAGTFTTAANDCDFVLTNGLPRWKIGIKIDDTGRLPELLDTLRLHCQGIIVWNNGKWQATVDKVRTVSGIIYTDDEIGHASMRVRGASEVPTHVVVKGTGQAGGYMEISAEAEAPEIVTLGRERITSTYHLFGLPAYDYVRRAALWIKNRRTVQDKEVRLIVNATGTRSLPGDVVEVTSSELNTTLAKVIVTDVTPLPKSQWEILGEFYDAAVYLDTVQTTTVAPTPAVSSPYDVPPAPSGVAVVEQDYTGTLGLTLPRAKLTWTQGSTHQYGGTEVRYQRGTDPIAVLGTFAAGQVYLDLTSDVTSYRFDLYTITPVGILSAVASVTLSRSGPSPYQAAKDGTVAGWQITTSEIIAPSGAVDIRGGQTDYATGAGFWLGSKLLAAPGALTAGAPTASGLVTVGTHSYKVTFVTAMGETTAGTASAQVNVTSGNQTVPLSAIPTGPSGTTARKIYRTVAGDTGNYLLLTTISNNTVTTFSDTIADASLGAAAPSANTAAVPRFSIGTAGGNILTWDGVTLAVTGTITATTGAIGGWTIGSTSLVAGSGVNTVGLDSGGTNPAIYAGSATPGSAPFRVTKIGDLFASSATITGNVTATSGAIGGWTIDAGAIVGALSGTSEIRIGATGYDSGTGFCVGNVAGTAKLFIGNSAGNKLTWDGSVLAVGGYLRCSQAGAAAGNSMIDFNDTFGCTITGKLKLVTAGGSSGDFQCASGRGYHDGGGSKLLGDRGAAVADADGTLADITTKFNTLLSRLRPTGHGLIAS